MRTSLQQRDPKARRLMVIGNATLAVGLGLWAFVRPEMANHRWFDAVCGFLLGISIATNLVALRIGRRRSQGCV